MNDQIKKLFSRYLDGKATPNERKAVEEWFENAGIDTEEFPLNDTVRKESIKRELFFRITEDLKAPSVRRMPRPWHVAAAVAIFLLAGFGVFRGTWLGNPQRDYLTVNTVQGEVRQVTLPDSSEIWVNASSIIRYPKAFGSGQREVELLEGNVFFNVQRDPDRPFLVKASGTTIWVLGTSFDVKAYAELPFVSVAVSTGKVEVSRDGRPLATLTPNQEISVNKFDGSVQRTLNSQATEWYQGEVILENASFRELALLLRNMYGLELKALKPEINEFTYTIQFGKDDPLEQTLSVVARMHNLDMERRGNEVTLF